MLMAALSYLPKSGSSQMSSGHEWIGIPGTVKSSEGAALLGQRGAAGVKPLLLPTQLSLRCLLLCRRARRHIPWIPVPDTWEIHNRSVVEGVTRRGCCIWHCGVHTCLGMSEPLEPCPRGGQAMIDESAPNHREWVGGKELPA